MPNYNFKSGELIGRIPVAWYIALIEMQRKYGKESIIHGGALRDLALGKEASDIDIAIPHDPEKTEGLLSFNVPIGWRVSKVTAKKNAYKYQDGVPQISGDLVNYKVPGLTPEVQVIPYKFSKHWFGRHVINNNDFGMNQIGYNGGRLLYNRNFEFDFFTKTFTFRKLGTEYMARNAINRAKGWEASGKYYGFEFDYTKAEDFLSRSGSPTELA